MFSRAGNVKILSPSVFMRYSPFCRRNLAMYVIYYALHFSLVFEIVLVCFCCIRVVCMHASTSPLSSSY